MDGFLSPTVRDIISVVGLITSIPALVRFIREAELVLSIPKEDKTSLPSLLLRCFLSPSTGNIRRAGGIFLALLLLEAGAAAMLSLPDILGMIMTMAAVVEAYNFIEFVSGIEKWL